MAILLDAVEATGGSAVYYPRHKTAGGTGTFQVEITGAATVKCQGRADSEAPWVDIAEYDADDMNADDSAATWVTLMPEMRANVSAYTSGAVSAWIGE